jgi:hypothetical protein
VAGSCEYGAEPSGSGATELVRCVICNRLWLFFTDGVSVLKSSVPYINTDYQE